MWCAFVANAVEYVAPSTRTRGHPLYRSCVCNDLPGDMFLVSYWSQRSGIYSRTLMSVITPTNVMLEILLGLSGERRFTLPLESRWIVNMGWGTRPISVIPKIFFTWMGHRLRQSGGNIFLAHKFSSVYSLWWIVDVEWWVGFRSKGIFQRGNVIH